jgi:DNA-nicking Smr family endonuclease
VTDDEADLFRRALADAKPLRTTKRAEEAIRKPVPKARFSRADEMAALNESLEADIDDTEGHGGESLRFRRPTVGRRTMRKLARGSFSVQAEIDLHGMTGSGARGPILKQKVNRWLRQWDAVLAFVSTRQVHGGTGAVYVLLRQD